MHGARLSFREALDEWLERAAAAPAVTRGWDPADRVVVATARVLGATLVTSDSRIIDARLVDTV